MTDKSPSHMPLPFGVILVPPFEVCTTPCIFMCFTSVLTDPSPSAKLLDNASLLVLPLFLISCSAANTCTTSKERTLLGAYLLAIFSSALMYMCIGSARAHRRIYSLCASWINHPILYIMPHTSQMECLKAIRLHPILP